MGTCSFKLIKLSIKGKHIQTSEVGWIGVVPPIGKGKADTEKAVEMVLTSEDT